MSRLIPLRAAKIEKVDRSATSARDTSDSDDSTHELASIDEFSTEVPGHAGRAETDATGNALDAFALVPPATGARISVPSRETTSGLANSEPTQADGPPLLSASASRRRWVIAALATLVAIQAPFLAYWGLRSSGYIGSATGTLAIETDPAGLEVVVDGRAVGRSPIELALPEGTRSVVLKQGTLTRTVAVKVTRGETVRHRFEFVAAAAPAAATSTGTLQVTSEPLRAALVVDGVLRGVTPLTLPDLTVGTHALAVRFPTATVEQRVDITQGATASLHIVAPPTSSAAAGWLSVDVASPLQIYEEDRLVGTTNIGRLLLPPGMHVLDFVSDELGFRTQRTVTVRPGTATDVRLELPSVTLSINAQPWAEVFVDGERVGETPIGTLSRPVGRHEIVLRHPQLGERRQTIILTTNAPNRISVDLRRP